MGNPKQKWTAAEEEALKKGIAKHGTGKWKIILRDPEFNFILYSRSNIDLKDKWRNLGVTASLVRPHGERPKNNAEDSPQVPTSEPPTSICTAGLRDATPDAVRNDSSRTGDLTHNEIIFEALSALRDPNGSLIADIFEYIKERHEVPPNFRKQLGSRLRTLAKNGRVEKIHHSYKLKTDASPVTTQPPPNQMRTQSQGIDYNRANHTVNRAAAGSAARETPVTDTLNSPMEVEADKDEDDVMDEDNAEDTESMCDLAEEIEAEILRDSSTELTTEMVRKAAADAASEIAEAENKSYVAAEAVKEDERVAQMAEDTESVLKLASEIFEKCSRGEFVHVA